jgi:hypothetical protein
VGETVTVEHDFTTQDWQRWRVHAELDQILAGVVPTDTETRALATAYRWADFRAEGFAAGIARAT